MPQTQGQIDECGIDKDFLDVRISWPDTGQSPQAPEKRMTHFAQRYPNGHYCNTAMMMGMKAIQSVLGYERRKPFNIVDARCINHPHNPLHSTPRYISHHPTTAATISLRSANTSRTYSARTTGRHGKGGREMATTQHVIDNSNRDKQVGSQIVAW